MTRTRVTATLVLSATVLGLTLLGVGSATAQETTTTTSTVATNPDYPGVPADLICRRVVTSDAPALPGATVNLTLTCFDKDGNQIDFIFKDGIFLRGQGNSTPFPLEPPQKVVNHAVTYKVTLPKDFELNSYHSATLTDRDTGKLKAIMRFYVDCKGTVTENAPATNAACAAKPDLPKTGQNHTDDLAKGGIALLAVGGIVVRVARKRRHTTTPTAA